MIIPDGQTIECGLSFHCDSNKFVLIIRLSLKKGAFLLEELNLESSKKKCWSVST